MPSHVTELFVLLYGIFHETSDSEAEPLAVILFLLLLKEEPLMMNPNPEKSRKIAKEIMDLMAMQNLPDEIEKPGKNGPSLDSLIPDKRQEAEDHE